MRGLHYHCFFLAVLLSSCSNGGKEVDDQLPDAKEQDEGVDAVQEAATPKQDSDVDLLEIDLAPADLAIDQAPDIRVDQAPDVPTVTVPTWAQVAPVCQSTSCDLQDITGISAVDAGNVFVCGEKMFLGAIYRYSLNANSMQYLLPQGGLVTHLFGLSPKHVYAAATPMPSGGGPELLRFDGSLWQTIWSGVGEISALWAGGSTAIFIARWGDGRYIDQFNGTSWDETYDAGNGNFLRGLWGFGVSDVLAVGSAGLVVRWNGSSWDPVTSNTTNMLRAVWGAGPNAVFIVGDNGTILKYDGNTMTPMTSPTTAALTAVWGVDDSEVYAVGNVGTILKYDGVSWAPMESGTFQNLTTVHGYGPKGIFAGGENNTFLHLLVP